MAVPSKSDLVYEGLKAQIESGAVRAGESLSEAELVERFGASRTPVRDALKRLAAEGLLTLVARHGARVAPISLSSVSELFEFRIVLESAAARLVARRAAADPGVRDRFAAVLSSLDDLDGQPSSAGRTDAFYGLTETFDSAIVDEVPNEHLRRAIAELRPHTARLRGIAHAAATRLDDSLEEHRAMCRAILSGDAAAAAASVRHHLIQTQRTIFASVVMDHSTGLGADLDL